MPNRLADESSPYLRQHQDNPVDWYPWGDEAFEFARRADKPVLLSAGFCMGQGTRGPILDLMFLDPEGEVERIEVRVSVQLTLAGTGVAESEVGGLKQGVESAIRGYLDKLAPGAKARRAQLSSLVLADNRIVDCVISLLPGDQPAVAELSLSANQVIDTITPFDFPLIESEELPAPLARSVSVNAIVPYIPVAGVTEQEARDALQLAFDSFISTRSAGNLITVDELAAVLRDDSRYALVRADMIVTVEVEETFLQLTDGLGSFNPEADDSLGKGNVSFELREGGI